MFPSHAPGCSREDLLELPVRPYKIQTFQALWAWGAPFLSPSLPPSFISVPSPWRKFTCARGFTVSVLDVLQKSVPMKRWTSFPSIVIVAALLFLINTCWQNELPLDGKVRVVTCYLTFCLDVDQFRMKGLCFPCGILIRGDCKMNVNFILLLRSL